MRTYRDGSLTLTNASTTIVGVGTAFASNVAIGDIVVVENAQCFEVVTVTDDTHLIVSSPANQTGSFNYAALRFVTAVNFRDLSVKIEQFLSDRQTNLAEFTTWMSGSITGGPNSDGYYPLTDRYGTVKLFMCPALIAYGYQDSIAQAAAAAVSATAAAASQVAADGSATAAAGSATSANTSKNAAATSATNAATSATAASTSATAANTSKTNAAASESNAAGSATAAATSATNSASSASAAATSATASSTSATAASGSATAAAGSATAANTSKVNAGTSETNALASKNAAATSATAAAASQTAAATSATNAATSETNAGVSATAAAGSATAANTSKVNAGTSETNALASKNAAATSATAASGSATAAAGSATAASTSQTAAAGSATAAATSATAASGSASAASTSQSAAATSATNAATSETNAGNSATAAASSATAANTSKVNAATSETNAATSAAAALASATNAAAGSMSGLDKMPGNLIANPQFLSNASLYTSNTAAGQNSYLPSTDASVPANDSLGAVGVSLKKQAATLFSMTFPLINAMTKVLCQPLEKLDCAIWMNVVGGLSSGTACARLVFVEYDSTGTLVQNTRVLSYDQAVGGWQKLIGTFTASATTYSFAVGVWNETSMPINGTIYYGEPELFRRGANLALIASLTGMGPANTAGNPIVAGTDLNNMQTPGDFGQATTANATLVLNYPVARAGGLVVRRVSANMLNQTYTDYQNGQQWIRSIYNGTWSAWIKTAADGTFTTLTNAPTDATQVQTSSDGAAVTPVFRLAGNAGSKESAVVVQGYSFTTANYGSTFLGTRSYGAVGAHTAVPSGRAVCSLLGAASDGTNYQRIGRIDFYTEETATPTSAGGQVRVMTTPVGSVLPTLSATFTSAGALNVVGGGTYGGSLSVTGDISSSGYLNVTKAINEGATQSIASATTTDLSTSTSNTVTITGTTAITGLGTLAAGVRRSLKFAAALTLTYDATKMILPTGASINTAANDTADFLSLGAGNWICINYQRANGKSVGLGNVDNTSDVNKPMSTAQLAYAQTLKSGVATVALSATGDTAVTTTQALSGMLYLTGALTGNVTVTLPAANGEWIVWNATTGAFTVTLKNASGPTLLVGQGLSTRAWSNGAGVFNSTTELRTVSLVGATVPVTPTAGDSSTQVPNTAFVMNAFNAVAAVPPGMVALFDMIWPPAGWLPADGSAVSRTTYATLFNAITYASVNVNITSGSNSITNMSINSGWFVGMPISGPGIPAGATVASANASTITISANATATSTGSTVRICPSGVGDGSTTFNVPDARGRVLRGWDAGAGVDSGRVLGSYQADQNASHNHGINDPGHNHSIPTAAGTAYTAGGVWGGIAAATGTGTGYTGISTQASGGSETRMKNVALVACIKY